MKKPVVDYTELRLSRLNDPRFAHLKLLAGWIIYFALYLLPENLIPAERSLLWFMLYDIRAFKQLQIFIMITQAVAMLVYIFYPSIQTMRPVNFARDNLLTRLMAFIYAVDTPTGVCPSLHVAYSMGIAAVWCRKEDAAHAWKGFMVLSAVLISISTAFVKQHSVVDIFAAIPVGCLADHLVFGRTRLNRWIG